MQIRVLPFGVLKESFGSDPFALELPGGASVADLLARLAAQAPALEMLGIAVSVNAEYADRNRILREDDEIGLLPPVSGGSTSLTDGDSKTTQQPMVVKLTRDPIEADSLVAAAKRGEDGAIVLFDGIVRNNSRGRQTLYLDYEAYEEMAVNQMQKLAREAGERFAIDRVGIVHRLGRLEIGESSIVIAVTSAHRAAAFDACRWLIDTLKRTVPVWKKEHFADGAVWKDGEPFPAELEPGSSS